MTGSAGGATRGRGFGSEGARLASWSRIACSSRCRGALGSIPNWSTSVSRRLPVGAEGFGLPAAPVEGEHPLPVKLLHEGVLRDELLELADDAVVAAERELAVDPVHHGGEA